MDNKTIVLPSARAIRHEQQRLKDESLFLPNYITMSDFISKISFVKGYREIDDESRILLLLEASNFQAFTALKIERNFFTFTKNSSYIFKFFAELSAELYEIENLRGADLYAEYEEHITILIELYKRYERLCNEKRYLDKIFLPKYYIFNESYLKRHSNIEINVDGHLTNFEFQLLEECCAFAEVVILFNTSIHNQKMQQRFHEIGIELTAGYRYKISLNNKEIVTKESLKKNSNIRCESFSESLLQVAFIKKEIASFIAKGYAPEKIAVILPNESLAERLKSFDTKSNLNFAMGESFTKSMLYIELQAVIKFIELHSHENSARVERVGDRLYALLLSVYYKNIEEVDFIALLEKIATYFTQKRVLEIYTQEVYSFKKLLSLMQNMSIKALLNLFMQRLASRSMDDIRGGKVTVMGVLETRSVVFDAVIIVDFDDKNVPKRSDKDMFLNTQIREAANLPTMSDRENLQKHYYEMLMSNSKEVALSYVGSTESSGSRFLKQLGIKENNIFDEHEYSKILFSHAEDKSVAFEDRLIKYSFTDVKLSNSRLKTFLTCRRKYYYKYIEHIKGHTIPQDMPQEYEIGNSVHLALKELYSKRDHYLDVKELEHDLNRELDRVCGESELEKYLIAIQKRNLKKFVQLEVARFQEGYRVDSCEKYFEIPYRGFTLIGTIDRVDKLGSDLCVLDYKTGSYKLYNKNSFMEATDFQLEFYYLLAAGEGHVDRCSFYDLKEVQIVSEAFLEKKLEVLNAILKDLLEIEEINTKQCENLSDCLYCEYSIMCQRD